MILRHSICFALLFGSISFGDEPQLLDDQFVLPKGFHIYRVADNKLTGSSYDLTFDGQGNLLVADGNAVRRLKDVNGDQVYDSFEVIADGKATSGRGPQGLLVYGDHLYVVAGDGVQLFSGYMSGAKLKHERRLGEKFNTGGDHAAHTVIRGLDGYIYLVSGDGGGTGGRKHITEDSSPVLEERAASVFRFDPKGEKWECVGAGGRNPPSLGMNYLGEFFSFDSDMEFHVDVPFYRPVSLNHWGTGGDLGWQSVGAFRRYFIDTQPAVLKVGRGSPNWGVVYEHHQFPEKYRDAFIVCDYRWKSATTGGYATSGRLVTFHLKRNGASWNADFTELAKAKPNAKDTNGNAINFALVDIDVAPDGSLLVTDHNQGVWRIFYDDSASPKIPKIDQLNVAKPSNKLLSQLLTLPQPAAEWSRVQENKFKRLADFDIEKALVKVPFESKYPLRQKIRAIRLLAAKFDQLPADFVIQLSKSEHEEIRGQAAWLAGIMGSKVEIGLLLALASDNSDFVRRRTAEALTRRPDNIAIQNLIQLLDDRDLAVRYASMVALSHRPTSEIIKKIPANPTAQSLLRILTATHLRKQKPDAAFVNSKIKRLAIANLPPEDQLDFLRVLSLFRTEVELDKDVLAAVEDALLTRLSVRDKRIRYEQVRLLGEYKIARAYDYLVNLLVGEKDNVAQFHIAMAIGKVPRPEQGWPQKSSAVLADWIISTQTGWFSEFGGKGLQFPGFWGTTLNKLAESHVQQLATRLNKLKPDSQLARSVFLRLQSSSNAESVLFRLYGNAENDAARKNIVDLLNRISSKKVTEFLLTELRRTSDAALKQSITIALSANGRWLKSPSVFVDSIFSSDDPKLIAAFLNGIVSCGSKLNVKESLNSLVNEFQQFKKVEPGNVKKLVCFRLLELMNRHPQLSAQVESVLVTLIGGQPEKVNRQAKVIWSSTDKKDGDKAFFVKSFSVAADPSKSEIVLTCDNEFILFVNGKRIAASNDWTKPSRIDLSRSVKKGKNLIAIEANNQGGPAGLIASVSWQMPDGKKESIVTDSTWRYSIGPHPKWKTVGTDEGVWSASVDVTTPTKNAIDAYLAFVGSKQSNDDLVIQEYWNQWYLKEFKTAFVARPSKKINLRSDKQIYQLIANRKQFDGNIENGRAVYLKTGCYACHGGIANRTTTIFGPALSGATLRLKRSELADAIVYPSKQVVERFKASMIATVDGKTQTGFITEQTDDDVTITDIDNNITRIPREDIEEIKAQNKSLMPDTLLNGLSNNEINDLLTFLNSLK